jgi:hypothetical protein
MSFLSNITSNGIFSNSKLNFNYLLGNNKNKYPSETKQKVGFFGKEVVSNYLTIKLAFSESKRDFGLKIPILVDHVIGLII